MASKRVALFVSWERLSPVIPAEIILE